MACRYVRQSTSSVLEDDADSRGNLWSAHRERILSRRICSNNWPCETLACILRMLSASAPFRSGWKEMQVYAPLKFPLSHQNPLSHQRTGRACCGEAFIWDVLGDDAAFRHDISRVDQLKCKWPGEIDVTCLL